MKKFISVLLCVLLCAVTFAGCTGGENAQSDIVLITDGRPVNDDGYNQSAWEGVTSFADDNSMTCRYYQPVLEDGSLTVENVEKYVELSADNGAKYIIFPGEAFAVSAYELAGSYPDISFILLDAIPHSADSNTDSFISNVMCVSFDVSQSGFLAGYMSVITGNTKLGFFGEAGSKTSAGYGAGFVQGAAYAAEQKGIPVTVDWADYDSPLIDYNYNIDVTACYEKIENATEDTFKVVVENGTGSGTYILGSNVTITAAPAPEGMTFDRWEVKSNTEGVKDKKVNISSEKEEQMNLLVENCDCTITATYKEIEGDYSVVRVMNTDGETVYSELSAQPDSEVTVNAPAAPENMVFDSWQTSSDLGDADLSAKEITFKAGSEDITLVPTYKYSDKPTFNVTVSTGEGGDGLSSGAGSYSVGDYVELEAAVPLDGYMFSHWESADFYGDSAGIALDNEYYWSTGFEMTDQYAAICERMFNSGVTAVFDGGNSLSSAYTAKDSFAYELSVISAGEKNSGAYSTIVNNYGEAVKDCLAAFNGGGVVSAGCATDGIYATFVSDDDEIKKQYDEVYGALAEGKIVISPIQNGAGYDFCKLYNDERPSDCLTLNGWFLEGVSVVG